MPRKTTNADRKSRLVAALRAAPGGLTRAEVYSHVFGNSIRAESLDRIFNELEAAGTVELATERRPVTVYRNVQTIRLSGPRGMAAAAPPGPLY